jgi:hypothetical protein
LYHAFLDVRCAQVEVEWNDESPGMQEKTRIASNVILSGITTAMLYEEVCFFPCAAAMGTAEASVVTLWKLHWRKPFLPNP